MIIIDSVIITGLVTWMLLIQQFTQLLILTAGFGDDSSNSVEHSEAQYNKNGSN